MNDPVLTYETSLTTGPGNKKLTINFSFFEYSDGIFREKDNPLKVCFL